MGRLCSLILVEILWEGNVMYSQNCKQATVAVAPAQNVLPLRICQGGLVANGMNPRYSFAHPGASVAQFLWFTGRSSL